VNDYDGQFSYIVTREKDCPAGAGVVFTAHEIEADA
jgi:hypothetical protein